MLQRLLQASLHLPELLQDLQILLHRVSVPDTHAEENAHSDTHHEPPQHTHVHTDQLLHAEHRRFTHLESLVQDHNRQTCVCVCVSPVTTDHVFVFRMIRAHHKLVYLPLQIEI